MIPDKYKPVPKVKWGTVAGFIVAIASAIFLNVYGFDIDNELEAQATAFLVVVLPVVASAVAGWFAPREPALTASAPHPDDRTG